MNSDINIEDLLNDPHAFGVPTFEEFAKNPEAWRKASDEILKIVDASSATGLKNLVVKQTYEVAGYKCKTLEEVERVAKNEGWDMLKMSIEPQIIPETGGKCTIHVKFVPQQATKESIIEDAIRASLSTATK